MIRTAHGAEQGRDAVEPIAFSVRTCRKSELSTSPGYTTGHDARDLERRRTSGDDRRTAGLPAADRDDLDHGCSDWTDRRPITGTVCQPGGTVRPTWRSRFSSSGTVRWCCGSARASCAIRTMPRMPSRRRSWSCCIGRGMIRKWRVVGAVAARRRPPRSRCARRTAARRRAPRAALGRAAASGSRSRLRPISSISVP